MARIDYHTRKRQIVIDIADYTPDDEVRDILDAIKSIGIDDARYEEETA